MEHKQIQIKSNKKKASRYTNRHEYKIPKKNRMKIKNK